MHAAILFHSLTIIIKLMIIYVYNYYMLYDDIYIPQEDKLVLYQLSQRAERVLSKFSNT